MDTERQGDVDIETQKHRGPERQGEREIWMQTDIETDTQE